MTTETRCRASQPSHLLHLFVSFDVLVASEAFYSGDHSYFWRHFLNFGGIPERESMTPGAQGELQIIEYRVEGYHAAGLVLRV